MKQNKEKIFNKKEIKPKRKELRNNLTFAEVIFWQNVKNKQVAGKKFRRQTSVGNYIVDFYCSEEKLVVELDGEVHFNEDAVKYDNERTKFLESVGLKVIRFENLEVLSDIDDVLKRVAACFKQNTPPPLLLSSTKDSPPQRGGD
ncbi:MAG: endonuclease domain-containing protein [Ignavibacteriales bacterium]|nr:MAG: endonuclease domain-containing protein [Ignavibacteriales bacterium]